jgi:hypothetical protein
VQCRNSGGTKLESRGSHLHSLSVWQVTRLAALALNERLLVLSLCVLARKHCARLLGEVGGAVLGEKETLGLCMPSPSTAVPGPCIHSRFPLRHDMKAWDRALRLCVWTSEWSLPATLACRRTLTTTAAS